MSLAIEGTPKDIYYLVIVCTALSPDSLYECRTDQWATT